MTTIAGQLNNFNNLLYTTKRNSASNYLEHRAGRVPLDLSYKGEAPLYEILNCDTAQVNGKYGDIKYKPKTLHSRPYYGYDAGFDPTILNAVRNKYTDVSGLLISPASLPKNKNDVNKTVRPLIPIGVIH
jgi:hypothetical protein